MLENSLHNHLKSRPTANEVDLNLWTLEPGCLGLNSDSAKHYLKDLGQVPEVLQGFSLIICK